MKSTEPLWWALFSVGGTLAAFLLPIQVLITGLGVSFGWISPQVISYQRLMIWLTYPLFKVYLFFMISLPLFHWAHRFRHVLIDLGLRHLKTPIGIFCYGSAGTGTVIAAFLLLSCP